MKILFLFIIAAAALLGAKAQDSLNVGYCHGQLNKFKNTAHLATGPQWVDAAIMIPAQKMKTLKGNRIESVKVGLATIQELDSLRVWVRTSLNGPDIAQGEVKKDQGQLILRGWNLVRLETPYQISSEQAVYIGYSFKQRNKTGAISVINQPQPNALHIKLGTDASWQDYSQSGTLCTEAVVRGDNLPQYDLAILSAVAQAGQAENTLDVKLKVRNEASKAITGFTINAKISQTSVDEDTHFARQINPDATAELTLTIPATPQAGKTQDIIVAVKGIDNGTDETPHNNTATAQLTFARKVLLEEFTTERCVNCPRVAGYIHNALRQPKYKDKLIVVCHHSGFYVDFLTQPCDKELLWFYNSSSTYAPGVMYDRYPYFKSGTTPVTSPSEIQLTTSIDDRLSRPAYAHLSLSTNYQPSATTLTVRVEGRRTKAFAPTATHLTIYLLEDDIPAQHQAGGSSDYRHHHVIRATNSTWGDPVAWTDNTFLHTQTFTLNPAWNKDNLHVVAFISNYDSSDPTNCIIENAQSQPLLGLPTGIAATASSTAIVGTRFYTVSGTPLAPDHLPKGLCIVKQTHADGTVTTRKILKE